MSGMAVGMYRNELEHAERIKGKVGLRMVGGSL